MLRWWVCGLVIQASGGPTCVQHFRSSFSFFSNSHARPQPLQPPNRQILCAQCGLINISPLAKFGLTNSEICVIGNVCPETIDEVFALLPSLKARGLGYDVPVGRRNGKISLASDTTTVLPPPTHSTLCKEGINTSFVLLQYLLSITACSTTYHWLAH